MSFNPKKLPKGFPDDGVIQQHGKQYITHVGLVWLANNRGKPWNGTIVDMDVKWNNNAEPIAAKVIYKVWDDEQEHTDVGDATVKNVGRMIVPHLIRMASTRAQNRALRAFVGYAGCTADELALGESYNSGSEPDRIGFEPQILADGYSEDAAEHSFGGTHAPANNPQPSGPPQRAVDTSQDTKTASRPPNAAANGVSKKPQCPVCGSDVYDNRATAQGSQPQWRCKSGKTCPGGKGDFGWASWEPDFFEVRDHSSKMPQAAPKPQESDRDERGESFYEDDLPF